MIMSGSSGSRSDLIFTTYEKINSSPYRIILTPKLKNKNKNVKKPSIYKI